MSALRDEAMARMCAALCNLEQAKATLMSAMELFLDPEEDENGELRESCLEDSLLGCHLAAEALGRAQSAVQEMGDELAETEEDGGDDEESGEDEDEDEDE